MTKNINSRPMTGTIRIRKPDDLKENGNLIKNESLDISIVKSQDEN